MQIIHFTSEAYLSRVLINPQHLAPAGFLASKSLIDNKIQFRSSIKAKGNLKINRKIMPFETWISHNILRDKPLSWEKSIISFAENSNSWAMWCAGNKWRNFSMWHRYLVPNSVWLCNTRITTVSGSRRSRVPTTKRSEVRSQSCNTLCCNAI